MGMAPAPQVVYGIQVNNAELAELLKKVLLVSFILGGWMVLMTILNFATGLCGTSSKEGSSSTQYISAIIMLGIGCAIPALGFFGAKKMDRNMLWWCVGDIGHE
jgi:hypothetical protein